MGEKALFCTGAGGFIGRYILSHYLEKEECDVYLLENGRFQERLEAYLNQARFAFADSYDRAAKAQIQ